MTEEETLPNKEEAQPSLNEEQNKQQEIEKLKAEAAEFKDKYFRALAEAENTRKRLQKEKAESQSYAIQNVIVDMLQPLDHFEQALKHTSGASNEIKQWVQGFDMIVSQFKQVLGDHGVQAFSSKGEVFDPHAHEAIETEESNEFAPGTIMEEYVRGYKLGTRVIRPAKVKVATAPVQEGN
jgi:molecular chaperone GrpE